MDKTYLKNTLVSIVTSLLSVFLIYYIINQVNLIGRDEVTIQYATTDNSTVNMQLQGMLCFSEQVVYAEGNYACVPDISNGVGVEKGNAIGKTYSSGYKDTAEFISRIDEQIAYLKECAGVRGGSLDTTDYDKQVDDNYTQLVDMIYSGNLSGSTLAAENWLVAKSKKNVSIGIASGYDKQIAELEEQKKNLIDGLGSSYGQVLAPCAGVYYSFVDGYEDVITENCVTTGSYEEISNIFDGSVNDDITDKNEIGKIITSGKWYTVCQLSSEEAIGLSVGTVYPATFDENRASVNLLLERMVAEYNSDMVMLVFSCDTNLDDFIGYRYLSLNLTVGSYTGLGVPCSAVRYIDGAVGVYIVDGNKARFRKIDIVAESGGRYIVAVQPSDSDEYESHLKLYDSIITSGKNVYDGRYVELA